jgi:imidazolonepropionase-like amidohydrolase
MEERKMKRHQFPVSLVIVLSFILGICLFAGGAADTFLIKGAKIYTSSEQGILTNATLLIEDGRIKKIIQEEEVSSVPVKDYSGKTITPGLVDAHSYLSGYYRLLENTEPIASDLIAGVIFDPSNPEVRHALESGVTTVNFVPRSENLVGGICSILKLSTDFASRPVLKDQSFLKISFNAEATRSDRAPTSLMGAEDMLNERMGAIKAGLEDDRTEIFQQRGLRLLSNGSLLPMIAASTSAEINTAIEWLSEWDMKGVIVGGEEANILSPLLKEKNVAVLLSPILPAYPEKLAKNAAHLVSRGIKTAFVSHAPEADSIFLRFSALMLYHQGISQEEALKTITSAPAQILGVSERVGLIAEGKDADFVVWEGEPLDLESRVISVYVNGHEIFHRDE